MRVISGDFRGLHLKSLKQDTTRPTSDKIKESLFNMIGPYFSGERVLDLYSGSGALAVEAISRGAQEAVCVEKNYQAMRIIQENIRLTRHEDQFVTLKITADKALKKLAAEEQIFDMVFLDPPYAKQTIEQNLRDMVKNSLLAKNAYIICETDKSVILPEEISTLSQIRTKTYGITKLTIYRNGR
ncbi:MAG TPA: 16S rRNA (guanine(966)-N(2))-methyltransferase RsmD [Tetragenococcus sp.]|nr:16S rRNA (guanine(966)-N(2))-methyltransferase RsmD [Tetragenococcus sp.]